MNESETQVQPAEVVSALSEITRSEIDVQIATAKKYPRSVQKFRQDALSMATADKDIAASCFYKLKRKNSDGELAYIEGPSVRLAEIVANAWGNLRFGARISAENEKEVVAQGIAHDLEKNVCNTIEVSRRITTKAGKRYGDDMIQVTKNAACSIALRNAIFKTVPFTYAKFIYEQAKKAAVGDTKTLGERRQSMLEAFTKMGVTKDQVLAHLEKGSIEDIGLSEIETMIGVFTAIKEGDTTIEEQFLTKPSEVEMPRPKPQTPAPVSDTQVVPEDAPPASPAQLANLRKIAAQAGIKSDGDFLDFVNEIGVKNPDAITAPEYAALLNAAMKKIDEVAQGKASGAKSKV